MENKKAPDKYDKTTKCSIISIYYKYKAGRGRAREAQAGSRRGRGREAQAGSGKCWDLKNI